MIQNDKTPFRRSKIEDKPTSLLEFNPQHQEQLGAFGEAPHHEVVQWQADYQSSEVSNENDEYHSPTNDAQEYYSEMIHNEY